MDYPLDMHNPALGGYAKADDEGQHKTLSAMGYVPAWQDPKEPIEQQLASDDAATAAAEERVQTVESLRAALDAAGVSYDRRWGAERLKALLPQ